MDQGSVVSRRTFLTRSAVAGGAVVWGVPVVSVLTGNAFASAGSAVTPPPPTSSSVVPPPTTATTSTAVLGTATTRPAETQTDDPLSPSTRVLGETFTRDPGASEDLPFTGMDVVSAVEVAGGLIAVGTVLHRLGATGNGRHVASAASRSDRSTDPGTDLEPDA